MSPACGDPGIVHVLTEFQTRQFGLAAAATKLPPATSLTHAPSTNVRLASHSAAITRFYQQGGISKVSESHLRHAARSNRGLARLSRTTVRCHSGPPRS